MSANIFHPTPIKYDSIPTVETLRFFFLMSPEYGETAAIHLDNGQVIVVQKAGKLTGVVGAGNKAGKYQVYIEKPNQWIEPQYLTSEEANNAIRALIELSQET